MVTRSSIRRRGIVGACVVGSMFAPMCGCQSGGLGGLLGSQSAMELLSPLVRDAANSYVGNLGSLTSSLGNLKDLEGVLDFVKKIEPTINELSSSYQTLAGTSGAERENLLKAFGPKFEATNADFLKQSQSTKSDAMWSRALTPVLDKVSLFQ